MIKPKQKMFKYKIVARATQYYETVIEAPDINKAWGVAYALDSDGYYKRTLDDFTIERIEYVVGSCDDSDEDSEDSELGEMGKQIIKAHDDFIDPLILKVGQILKDDGRLK